MIVASAGCGDFESGGIGTDVGSDPVAEAPKGDKPTGNSDIESGSIVEDNSVAEEAIRFATFNLALNRPEAGALLKELQSGDSSAAKKLAEVVQRVRPHVILLNEFDADESNEGLAMFQDKYLGVAQSDQSPIEYSYRYSADVNTGEPTEFDLDQDGKKGGAGDCFGFGRFPGQYGMAVLSQFPIKESEVRTFQKFLWKDMPGALKPATDGVPFYESAVFEALRLSSKSHWDVPIETPGGTIHFLVCHPTPPVFDGPEDRNGCRNHDEIRIFADYVSDLAGKYLYDDRGRKGGISAGAAFVIAGDLNADPNDGDSANRAVAQLLEHPKVNGECLPISRGAAQASEKQGEKNLTHQGPANADTGDFADDATGNLRIDYVLPSKSLRVVGSGVFWPAEDEPAAALADASDHHLVWIDVTTAKAD